MLTNGTGRFEAIPSQLVAAVFFDDVSARDAIADLKLAGFPSSQIAVALSKLGQGAHHAAPDLEGKHSILWKARHSRDHGLHPHGPDVSTREDAAAAARAEEQPFVEVDLTETLAGMGIADDTIKLLEDRMGRDGVSIMVNAGVRLDKVESILVQNRGILRTVMVTQRTRVTDEVITERGDERRPG